MAEKDGLVFDPRDINEDGIVNFVDDELAQIEVRRAEMDAAVAASKARREAGETIKGPDFSLSDLEKRRIAINQEESIRRDSLPVVTPAGPLPSTVPVTGNPLGSAAAFREREIAAGLEVRDVNAQKSAQSTDSNN